MLVKRVSSLGEFSVKSVCSGKAFTSGSSGMRRIFFYIEQTGSLSFPFKQAGPVQVRSQTRGGGGECASAVEGGAGP